MAIFLEEMLRDWIRVGRERGASDLHLESGTPLVYRVRGELVPAGEVPNAEALLQITRETLGEAMWQEFLSRRSADLSRTIAGVRCRINVYQTGRGIALAIRLLSSFQNNLKDCNLHPDLLRFVEADHGLVIISGATGSGKSTTLAALIEEINVSRRRQIVTVESPIEYFFSNRQSFIRQREVSTHTPSFEQAIVDSMREDPDVLVISEMRTPDVMRLTLNAAETGHLVLATMHSATSAEALSRICMSFPAELQSSIRAQLADSLLGVICQRLEYLPQHQLRIPLCEVLVANTGARATIRGGQFSQIVSSIQTGGEDGMWSFERYQKWIDQKREWVRPTQAARQVEREEPAASISPAQPKPRTATRASSPKNAVLEKPSVDLNRIEIASTEEDLELLAKKISDDEEG